MPKKKTINRLIPVATAVLVLSLAVILFFAWSGTKKREAEQPKAEEPKTVQIAAAIALPKPTTSGRMSLETAIFNRRSRRNFTGDSLTLKQIGQVLWAAQGVTVSWGGRTTPSAKSVYPLTIYLAVYKVDGLGEGLYQYIPGDREPVHQLALIASGDFRDKLGEAVGQNSAKEAPVLFFIAGNMGKMAEAHGGMPSDELVYLEAGHASQNVYLQSESLGLGTVALTGFDKARLASILNLPGDESIIYVMPVGIYKR